MTGFCFDEFLNIVKFAPQKMYNKFKHIHNYDS